MATAFNPILLDLDDRIDTARLTLRAPRPGDGALICQSVTETLDDLRRFPASMSWALEEPSVERSEDFARRAAANWILRTVFNWLAFARDSDELACACGLHRFNWATRVFEIGWWCRKRFQGQGLMHEAAGAVVEYGFRHFGARRIWCQTDDLNEPSWRLAERLGMVHEGTLRSERCDPDGTRGDTRVYALTR